MPTYHRDAPTPPSADDAHVTPGQTLQRMFAQDSWQAVREWIEEQCPDLVGRLALLSSPSALARPGAGIMPQQVTVCTLETQRHVRPGDRLKLEPTYGGNALRVGPDGRLRLVHPEDIGMDSSGHLLYLPSAWRCHRAATPQAQLTALGGERIRMLIDGEMSQTARHSTAIDLVIARVMSGFDAEACGTYHGPSHWARVAVHARAAARAEGVDPLVAHLFALVHDSQREDDGEDPEHGTRAADFITDHRDSLFAFLRDEQVQQLEHACRLHSEGLTEGEAIVRACWDGDRLDLGRVDVTPDPRYMCTDYGRRADVIRAAVRMSGESAQPDAFAMGGDNQAPRAALDSYRP